MSLAVIYSRAQRGIDSPLVTVETHLSNGLPSFSIVGLPETAVKESKDRVRSAILNSEFEFPIRRITVNLAPADLPKEGGRFDLPIALGILSASRQLQGRDLSQYEFAGELALSGALRSFRGCLPFAINTHQAKRTLIVPSANAGEAALPKHDQPVLYADHLLDVCAHINGKKLLPRAHALGYIPAKGPDLADIRGQYLAKRALEICAAGEHSLLMIGPPGSGKTMLASRLAGLLPPLREQEALAIAMLYSVSQQGFNPRHWYNRPFRAPHHTASGIALVGGGSNARPGEISLAHHGVLFLDELPEFARKTLEMLREPLESGTITISRAAQQAHYPAQFQLIAAMNPCPCGYLGDQQHTCRCSSEQIHRYQNKLSGPLLDRIDMHIEVPSLPPGVLTGSTPSENESSAQVQKRVMVARERQIARFDCSNHYLQNKQLEEVCALDEDCKEMLERVMRGLKLSARSYHRILKVARTIADLADSAHITPDHLSEAIAYRRLDRLMRH